ncbi:MAG TPA: UbiH/UbiF/VisC/COQ6 family ubiquinone biosynthesis hydroxylase [Rhizomicrobium sp.]|jgi:2-octaprenyl-6-methoxyphenol hydroxylase|nr:UbiH/UbiF/VisC/COQ6 family ubiquinone biosynthesis hydroxylase [Rhizomicrobium sp.]
MKAMDAIVCGGGMVGLTLGLALAKGGLKAAVVDSMPPEKTVAPEFDGRVSALAYANVRMLQVLEVWPHLAHKAQPIREILVSDGAMGRPASPFSMHFDAQDVGADSLGHIAENRHIRAALHTAIAAEKNLTLIAPAQVRTVTVGQGQVRARLSDGSELQALLAIAADGRDSRLRQEQGIGVIGWSYPQTGIVATVHHAKPHNGVAYEHFLPSGPFAILPMTGDRASLVWTEAKDKAPAMLALSPKDFDAEVAARFGAHLGKTEVVGARWSYPLHFHLARDYVRPRFALAGDCAHGIHPIAGQGLNLGLKDAAALAETVLDAARLGQDIGALDVLKRYERWRRFDSFALAASTDALNRLFSNDIAPLRQLRDLGLGVVDAIGPLRRFFMRHAGGDIGKLPRLLKGELA